MEEKKCIEEHENNKSSMRKKWAERKPGAVNNNVYILSKRAMYIREVNGL